jgi:dTDP-4-amino-4,6-dideoxygalactose transaminase
MKIGFNKPYQTGKEREYICDALKRQQLSGNGYYTRRCQRFMENKYGFSKVLLTTSCTDALEMAAILLDIQPGDEVIMPSYTFTSTANAFILRGATIIFADSQKNHPNLDAEKLEPLITPQTKAIVVVHYGGVACDMDRIMALANRHDLYVVEDAAQAIDTRYKGRPVGSIGHFGCFSFHDSKNITCGEGGMLAINDEKYISRAEIIWEKGTNRAAFFRGEVKKYMWQDIGSSFLPSELNAAYLYAQLEQIDKIQAKRVEDWNYYQHRFSLLVENLLPQSFPYSVSNAHSFSLICKNELEKQTLEAYLQERGIQALGHYVPLHMSDYFHDRHDGRALPNAEKFAGCLLRLPLYYEMTLKELKYIIKSVRNFYEENTLIHRLDKTPKAITARASRTLGDYRYIARESKQ